MKKVNTNIINVVTGIKIPKSVNFAKVITIEKTKKQIMTAQYSELNYKEKKIRAELNKFYKEKRRIRYCKNHNLESAKKMIDIFSQFIKYLVFFDRKFENNYEYFFILKSVEKNKEKVEELLDLMRKTYIEGVEKEGWYGENIFGSLIRTNDNCFCMSFSLRGYLNNSNQANKSVLFKSYVILENYFNNIIIKNDLEIGKRCKDIYYNKC